VNDDALLLLENQMCFALYAASRAMTKAYEPLLSSLGVTYPQYLVMLVLWEKSPLSVKALGERLQLDSGTLSPLLQRLEKQGLVERARSAADERVVEIHLTAPGKRLRQKALSIPKALACQFGLTLPEISRMRSDLRRLTESLRSTPTGMEPDPTKETP